MKIAVDVRALMNGRHSGVEEYTWQLLNAMVRVRPDNEYLAFYNAWGNVRMPKLPDGVELHAFTWPNKILNGSQLVAGFPKWDSLVKADVYFAPGIRLLPLNKKVPLVVTAHDLSFVRFPEFYTSRQRWWHWYVQPKQLFKRAERVVSVSENTARDLGHLYGIDRKKISVVYSGVRLARESKGDVERVKRELDLPGKYILFLGAFEPRKNIAGLIRAFGMIADFIDHDLVLAGCSGWLPRSMVKALEESKVRRRIHVIGFVSEKDKGPLYEGADLFVYPSFYEGFGIPPLEALVNGTPVVTSFNSALPEVVGEWATLVDPYRTQELALVIKEELRQGRRIEPAIRDEVARRYSWERAGRETLVVLEEAVK